MTPSICSRCESYNLAALVVYIVIFHAGGEGPPRRNNNNRQGEVITAAHGDRRALSRGMNPAPCHVSTARDLDHLIDDSAPPTPLSRYSYLAYPRAIPFWGHADIPFGQIRCVVQSHPSFLLPKPSNLKPQSRDGPRWMTVLRGNSIMLSWGYLAGIRSCYPLSSANCLGP